MRRTQEEMKKIRNDIVSFIEQNNGEASYSELFDFLEETHDFNDSQLSSLLYRMSSVWSELTRPVNGIYRLGGKYTGNEEFEEDISDDVVNEVRPRILKDKLSDDLTKLVDTYKEEVADNLLTLTNEELIEMQKKLKSLAEFIGE